MLTGTTISVRSEPRLELFDRVVVRGRIPIPGAIIDTIAQLRRDLGAKGIRVSDRRWGKTHGVLRAHALLEGRSAIEEDDLAILKHVLWSSPDQQAEISKLCARLSNPINGKATDMVMRGVVAADRLD